MHIPFSMKFQLSDGRIIESSSYYTGRPTEDFLAFTSDDIGISRLNDVSIERAQAIFGHDFPVIYMDLCNMGLARDERGRFVLPKFRTILVFKSDPIHEDNYFSGLIAILYSDSPPPDFDEIAKKYILSIDWSSTALDISGP